MDEKLPTLHEMERELIKKHLVRSHYNTAKAARTLGMSRVKVYTKAREYGWNVKELKAQHRLCESNKVKNYTITDEPTPILVEGRPIELS